MTMNNFDPDLFAGMPGVTLKKFCSLSCTNEATGTIAIQIDPDDEETFPLPICESCAKRVLDMHNADMVD